VAVAVAMAVLRLRLFVRGMVGMIGMIGGCGIGGCGWVFYWAGFVSMAVGGVSRCFKGKS
jgi:hypothetical protein